MPNKTIDSDDCDLKFDDGDKGVFEGICPFSTA